MSLFRFRAVQRFEELGPERVDRLRIALDVIHRLGNRLRPSAHEPTHEGVHKLLRLPVKIGSDDLRHGQGCGDRHHFLNRLLLQSGCLGNLFGNRLAHEFRAEERRKLLVRDVLPRLAEQVQRIEDIDRLRRRLEGRLRPKMPKASHRGGHQAGHGIAQVLVRPAETLPHVFGDSSQIKRISEAGIICHRQSPETFRLPA